MQLTDNVLEIDVSFLLINSICMLPGDHLGADGNVDG